ncbi:MAG: AAA family ATPase [Planctomycetota bacterium]
MFKLRGIKIKNHFKGLGPLEINDLSDINIFIGRNNSGKSTLLEVIQYLFSPSWGLPLNSQYWQYSYDTTRSPVVIEGVFNINPNSGEPTFSPLKYKCQQNRIDFDTLCSLVNIEISYEWVSPGKPAKRSESINVSQNIPEMDSIKVFFSNINNVNSVKNEIENNPLQQFYKNIESPPYVSIIGPEQRRLGAPTTWKDKNGQILNGAISQKLFAYKESPNKGKVSSLMEKHMASDKTFNPFDVRSADVVYDTVKLPDGSVAQLSFSSKGSGEQDSFGLTALIETINIESNKSFILLDEPEISKHPKLQRGIFDAICKLSDKNQIFIATHSPVFCQFKKNASVYLLKNPDNKITTKVYPVKELSDVRDELGLIGMDALGYNAVLFVEGETEENTIPYIFELIGSNLRELNLKIINLKGNGNISPANLIGFIEFLNETGVKVYIWADKDGKIVKQKEKLLKLSPKFLNNNNFKVWNEVNPKYNTFEDLFSEDLLLETLVDMLKENSVTDSELSLDKIKEKYNGLGSNKFRTNRLGQIYHELQNGSFSKAVFGGFLGKKILAKYVSDISQAKEPIIAQVKLIIDYLTGEN